MRGETFGHPLEPDTAPRRARGRESWVAAVARRAVLPAPVVERVLAAMIDLGPESDISPGGAFEAVIAAAIEAHRRQADDLARLILAADRARSMGACGGAGLDIIRGGKR